MLVQRLLLVDFDDELIGTSLSLVKTNFEENKFAEHPRSTCQYIE
jgi:hypothetical protein